MQEPLLLLGEQRFQNVDIRLRVRGGGHVSQAYGEPCDKCTCPEHDLNQTSSVLA